MCSVGPPKSSVSIACGVYKSSFPFWKVFHCQAFLIRPQPWCNLTRSLSTKVVEDSFLEVIHPLLSLQSPGSKGSDREGRAIVWEWSVQKYYLHLLKALFMSPQSLFLFPCADRRVQTNQATCRQRGQSQSVHLADPETLLSAKWQKKHSEHSFLLTSGSFAHHGDGTQSLVLINKDGIRTFSVKHKENYMLFVFS